MATDDARRWHDDATPLPPPRTSSWWLDVDTRAAFMAAAEREQARMANTPEARRMSEPIIVGHLRRRTR